MISPASRCAFALHTRGNSESATDGSTRFIAVPGKMPDTGSNRYLDSKCIHDASLRLLACDAGPQPETAKPPPLARPTQINHLRYAATASRPLRGGLTTGQGSAWLQPPRWDTWRPDPARRPASPLPRERFNPPSFITARQLVFGMERHTLDHQV